MCDLICDVITCVCRFDTGTTNASNIIMFENQENRKYGNKRNFFYTNLYLKDRFTSNSQLIKAS